MTLVFQVHYFLWYGALTSIFGYESVYARYYTNATTIQYGYLKMILPFLTVIVTPIVCSMADRERKHRLFFTLALIMTFLSMASLSFLPVTIFVRDYSGPSTGYSWFGLTNENSNSLFIGPWIYYCATLLVCDLSIGVATCLADSFAVLRAELSGASFGQMIVWGTLGWATSALVLSGINQISFMPRLLPGIMFGTILLSIDVIIVTFWKKSRDFELDFIPHNAAATLTGSSSSSQREPSNYLPMNESIKINLGNDLSEQDGSLRRLTKSPLNMLKDDSSAKRQNDATSSTIETINSDRDSIEPIAITDNHFERFFLNISSKKKEKSSPRKPTSFRVQMLLLGYVILRRKSLIRFLLLFVCSGFFMSMHWNYYFLYLESIYHEKFKLISALSMIGQSLFGELPFFILSRKLIDIFGRSHTISFSLISIGIRFLLYNYLIPLSMYGTFLADCLQGPNYGLFYVVMTEIGLEYSFCDDLTIERLVARGEIEDYDRQQIDSLRMALRSTVQSVAFASYEGLGVGLGSLLGGWLVDRYGFATLWNSMSIAAITIGVLNIMIELSCREADPEEHFDENSEFTLARRLDLLQKLPLPVSLNTSYENSDSLVPSENVTPIESNGASQSVNSLGSGSDAYYIAKGPISNENMEQVAPPTATAEKTSA